MSSIKYYGCEKEFKRQYEKQRDEFGVMQQYQSNLNPHSQKTTMVKISISIDVPNLQQAEKFYTQAIGCTKKREQNNMIVLSAGNCDIYLQEKKEGSNPLKSGEASRNYSRHWTPVHIDFLTKDIDEAVKKVISLGGTHHGGDSGDWGSIAYCADPFGNGFCLINE
jgi:predicted enzyme related to lactoylglutathione lyase